jgi:hypothetical protein
MSTVVHKGKLYAGTGTYDWDRSNVGRGGQNHVYSYEGENKWRAEEKDKLTKASLPKLCYKPLVSPHCL